MDIVNPFYNSTGEKVNLIEKYGQEFLESNFTNLLNKIQNYLGSELSREKKNMCAAINIGEIQQRCSEVENLVDKLIYLYIYLVFDNIPQRSEIRKRNNLRI